MDLATITHKITLSMTDFNLVGDIKVRQADDETQVFDAVILEHGMIKNFEGLKPFFCLMAREVTGQGVSEEPVTEYNGSKGTLKYTVSANAMQMVGRNEAYFSFRKELSNGEWIEQFSTRSFFYTVEKSIYTQPFKDSNYWWTFKELYRKFLDYQDSGKISWEEFVEQNREILESVDPGGVILTELIDARGGFNNVNERFNLQIGVNPLWFGAKGDGNHDDGLAIKACHEYANNNDYNVIYPSNKTFLIKETSEIPVKTSVDFNRCTIVIDESYEPQKSSFLVLNDEKPIIASSMSAIAGNGNAHVYVENENEKVFIREGANDDAGVNKGESFCVNDLGSPISRMMFTYSAVTTVEIRKFNKKRIEIKNGFFKSFNAPKALDNKDFKNYIFKNILVNRNNVSLSNITHVYVDDVLGNRPHSGFLRIYKCADVSIDNAALELYIANTIDSNGTKQGTYDLSVEETCNVRLSNIFAWNDKENNLWSFMAGNKNKDITFDTCHVTNIDSHIGSCDVTIKNSKIGKSISLNGFGELVISNCRITSDAVLRLREDYGGSWNGNITITDCVLKVPETLNNCSIIKAYNVNLDHDFGYDCYLSKDRIVIKNVVIEDNGTEDEYNSVILYTRLKSANVNGKATDYYFPKNIDVDNVYRKSGNGMRIFSSQGFELASGVSPSKFSLKSTKTDYESYFEINSNVNVSVRNVNLYRKKAGQYDGLKRSSLFTDNFDGITKADTNMINSARIIPKFIINNCGIVNLTVNALPTIIMCEDCEIIGANCSDGGLGRSVLWIKNCNIAIDAENGGYNFRSNGPTTTLENCTIKQPILAGVAVVDVTLRTQLYPVFGDVDPTAKQYLRPLSTMSNCQFDAAFDFSVFDVDFKSSFGDLNRNFGKFVLRKIGNTFDRPQNAQIGDGYYDTSLSKFVFYNGSTWI